MSPVSCGLWSRGAGDVLSHSSPGRSPLVARSWPYSPSGWGQVGGEGSRLVWDAGRFPRSPWIPRAEAGGRDQPAVGALHPR